MLGYISVTLVPCWISERIKYLRSNLGLWGDQIRSTPVEREGPPQAETKHKGSSKDNFRTVISGDSLGCGEDVQKPSPCYWKGGLDRKNLDSRISAARGDKPVTAVILTNISFIVSL